MIAVAVEPAALPESLQAQRCADGLLLAAYGTWDMGTLIGHAFLGHAVLRDPRVSVRVSQERVASPEKLHGPTIGWWRRPVLELMDERVERRMLHVIWRGSYLPDSRAGAVREPTEYEAERELWQIEYASTCALALGWRPDLLTFATQRDVLNMRQPPLADEERLAPAVVRVEHSLRERRSNIRRLVARWEHPSWEAPRYLAYEYDALLLFGDADRRLHDLRATGAPYETRLRFAQRAREDVAGKILFDLFDAAFHTSPNGTGAVMEDALRRGDWTAIARWLREEFPDPSRTHAEMEQEVRARLMRDGPPDDPIPPNLASADEYTRGGVAWANSEGGFSATGELLVHPPGCDCDACRRRHDATTDTRCRPAPPEEE